MFPDIDKVTRLIREVAEEEVLPRFRRLGDDESWEKKKGGTVTVADHAAEERLAEGLATLTPGTAMVGEEAVDENPALLESLTRNGPVWIIDPIDGTKNFAAGSPDFAMIVAYVVDGETRAGWIHSPVTDVTAVAEAGAGAFMGGERLHVADAAPVAELTGSLGKRLRENRAFSGRFAHVTNTRCCGIDYLAIGSGRIHFAFYRGLKPWDHAAGHLIHREAGGYSFCLDGDDYRPNRRVEGGLLLAPNDELWDLLAADIPDALKG